MLRELQTADRPATADEQQVLARWSGWGAVPAVFDEHSDRFADARAELKQLLDEREWRAASKTTLNAHYTDAAIAQTMWDVVTDAGFGTDREPVRVLEPGCGAGTFIGLAPAAVTAKDSALFGVELDPTTAAIAKHLYPHADIRQESFADTRIPRDYLDLVIGNVPFGKVALHDPVHNGGNHSLHNHFIIKSLALTRPGGVVTVLTSHYTMDATNPAARREIAAMADLVAAVRLPMSAHQRAAGTQVITDVLVLRRRDPADGPGEADGWASTVAHRRRRRPAGQRQQLLRRTPGAGHRRDRHPVGPVRPRAGGQGRRRRRRRARAAHPPGRRAGPRRRRRPGLDPVRPPHRHTGRPPGAAGRRPGRAPGPPHRRGRRRPVQRRHRRPARRAPGPGQPGQGTHRPARAA